MPACSFLMNQGYEPRGRDPEPHSAAELRGIIPNEIKLVTAFFDSEANIDNWLSKSGSRVRLIEDSISASSGNRSLKGRTPHADNTGKPSTAPITGRPFSVQSIQEALGIVNRRSLVSIAPMQTPGLTATPFEKGAGDSLRWMITFFEGANASSAFHELGHHLLTVLTSIWEDGQVEEMSNDANTSDYDRIDYNTFRIWDKFPPRKLKGAAGVAQTYGPQISIARLARWHFRRFALPEPPRLRSD